jgi:hypothetical protein
MSTLTRRASGKSYLALLIVILFCALAPYLPFLRVAHAQVTDKDPIAYVGHGAMFDQTGSEIAPTLDFVRKAQAWYQSLLVEKLDDGQKARFSDLRKKLTEGLTLDEQSQLVLNGSLLDWLIDQAKLDKRDRIRGKNNLLKSLLTRKLTNNPDIAAPRSTEPFKPNPRLSERLKTVLGSVLREPRIRPVDILVKANFSSSFRRMPGPADLTTNAGASYRAECLAAGVPVPPDFGPGTSWVSQGTIPQNELFIVAGLGAEVLTFRSSAASTPSGPDGMCVALPRFDSGNQVILDGVICLGQTGKACFWDNEKNGVQFNFTRGTAAPIGNFGGGSELIGDVNLGGGGVCSDCHAGENPYIIHGTVLSGLSASGLPTFAPGRFHIPIVRSGDTVTWPDSVPPMNSPSSCSACHGTAIAAGFGGRLPHLSPLLGGYCGVTLRASLGARVPTLAPNSPNARATMPQGAPGSLVCTPNLPNTDPQFLACTTAHTEECNAPGTSFSPTDQRFVKCTPQIKNLLNWCGVPASGDASSRGDPHVTTFNNVPYNFQGAGEFVHLIDASGLEVQVRQTPISSAGGIPPDDQTGLASCVSIITAVAARVGKNRITLEPASDREQKTLVLRVDGEERRLDPSGIKLGGGGRVVSTAAGSLEISSPDGTRLIITTHWWQDQSRWFMNVDAVNTHAREGVMGAITAGNWLPALPDGTPMGPRPVSLSQRYFDLNSTFADAWRVTNATSLFDYTPGTSTATFTDKKWPPNKPPCVAPGSAPPQKPINREKALSACQKIKNKTMRAQCVFDVSVTGEGGFAQTYLKNQALVP